MQSPLSFDHFVYQTPPEKTSTQEQKPASPPIEDGPIDADTRTVNSPIQQTVDGKKFICLFIFQQQT